jgi:fibronectin type 3 domain-containing protein
MRGATALGSNGEQSYGPPAQRALCKALVCALIGLGLLAAVAEAAEGPQSLAVPSISGIARDGQRLKANRGSWSGQKPIDYAYGWARCDAAGDSCTAISSSPHASRRANHEDVGHTLRVTVTATDAAGTTSATSQPSELVEQAAPRKGKAPKITGVAHDGQLLTVGAGSWKGTPPESIAYEWQTCSRSGTCTTIPGADSASYRVASPQIGSKLRALVTAKNAAGSLSVLSGRTAKVLPGVPVNTLTPSVGGSLLEGQALTAGPGTWAGTGPISFAYQWLRCSVAGGGCAQIEGANEASYTATGLDLASNLAVVVTATNAQGSVPATSAETQPILGVLPTNTILPSISGLLQDGGLLSVATGSWTGSEPISYTYQWQSCSALGQACETLADATGSSLKLDPSEIGRTLDVVVTATNVAGSTSVTSSLTSLIAGILPTNTSLPSIGGTLKLNQLLTATPGSWTGSEPISYAYQWQLCILGTCTDIAKATSPTFVLGALDVANTVRVVVTATNVAGKTTAISPVTGTIAGLL